MYMYYTASMRARAPIRPLAADSEPKCMMNCSSTMAHARPIDARNSTFNSIGRDQVNLLFSKCSIAS